MRDASHEYLEYQNYVKVCEFECMVKKNLMSWTTSELHVLRLEMLFQPSLNSI